jgi:hypothetical protein
VTDTLIAPPTEAPDKKPPRNLTRIVLIVLVIIALYGDFLLLLTVYRHGWNVIK